MPDTKIKFGLSIKTLVAFGSLFLLFFLISGKFISDIIEDLIIDQLDQSMEVFVNDEASDITEFFRRIKKTGVKSSLFISKMIRDDKILKDSDYNSKYTRFNKSIRTDTSKIKNKDISGVFISEISPDTERSIELVKRTETGFDEYAKGLSVSIFNMYFITKGQMIRIYPKNWALQIEGNHNFHEDIFYSIATPENNPGRLPVWTEPYYDPIWKHWMTSLITPVYVDNKFEGIVGHDVILDEIYLEVLSKRFYKTGYGMIFNSKGHMIISPELAQTKLKNKNIDIFENYSHREETEIFKAIDKLNNSLLNDKSLKKIDYSDNSDSYFVVSKKLDFLDWHLGIVIPASEALSGLPAFYTNFAIIVLLFLLVLLISVIIITRLIILKPIYELNKAAIKISEQNFESRIEIKGHDEISQLAESFVKMKIKLKDTMQQLKRDLTKREKMKNAIMLSEEKYRAVIDNANEVILIAQDGLIKFFNPAFPDIAGYTDEECMEQPFMKFLHEDDRDMVLRNHYMRLKGEQVKDYYVTRIRSKVGSIIWLEIKPVLINWDGKPATLNFITDVTQKIKAEKALKQSEKKYRQLYENMIESFALVDMKGNILDMNPAFEKLIGYSREELKKMSYKDITPEKWWPIEHKLIYEQVIPKGYSDNYEKEYIRKDGKIIPVELHIFILKDDRGENIGMWSFVRDISERKRIEQLMKERIDSLTKPLTDSVNYSFELLFDIEKIQEIQDAFSEATGVAALITEPDGTPITKPSRFTFFCEHIVRKSEKGRNNCIISDAEIRNNSGKELYIAPCKSAGLWDGGTKIMVGDQHIANWLFGQVKNEKTNLLSLEKYADEIGADKKEYMAALEKVPEMSLEQFEKIGLAITLMADQLSQLAYKNIQQARAIEERRKAEERVKKLNADLELKVEERTAELQVAKDKLELALQSEKELSALKTRFVSMVSHEYRTPLTVIMLSTYVLEKIIENSDKSNEQLKKIRHSVEIMTSLLEDVITVGKIDSDSGVISSEFQEFNLLKFFTDLIEQQKTIDKDNHEINLDFDLDEEIIISDKKILGQISRNLLSNALKYSEPGKLVQIKISKDDDKILMAFMDKGYGIGFKDQEKIFDPFYRNEKFIGSISGSGLGLTIVRNCVDALKGEISIQSEHGKGTTFFVKIPKI